ncbi:ParA family protein [Thauera butanivorans]|uniref:ParA family protein n=1 Tax=Thauera butanivorans TaxID=86174 RepID=UPI0008389CFB|nr:ParA family protein [Thauera butanivorans]
MVIFGVIGTKGGVGKTTLSANIGALIADMGLRVLLVDADIQASLSKFYDLDYQAPLGLTEVIHRGAITDACISHTAWERLDIVLCDAPRRQLAGDGSSSDLERFLQNRMDMPMILRRALRAPYIDENYDVVVIDTPGAQGPLLFTAALAADQLVTPVLPETPSAREFRTGTLELLGKLSEAAVLGIRPGPVTAVINRADRTNDAKLVMAEIRQGYLEFGGNVRVASAVIPAAVIYKEAATHRTPVHRMRSIQAFETMHQLVWELLPNLEGVYAGATTDGIESNE